MILIDTSGLLAAVDPRQTHHAAAARILTQPQRRLLSPCVLAELDYLITANAGSGEAMKLLGDVAKGVYELEAFTARDVAAAVAVLERYATLKLGIADASILVLASRHACIDVFTLDQRHFRAVSGPGGSPFRLLPLDGPAPVS